MDTYTAAILGSWIFAAASALAKNVTGGFMILAFVAALLITFFCTVSVTP